MDYILRKTEEFVKDSIRFVPVADGITAVVGKVAGSDDLVTQSFSFSASWDAAKSAEWVKQYAGSPVLSLIKLHENHDLGDSGKSERITKFVKVKVMDGTVDEESHTAWCVVSDESVDRSAEVIELSAWGKRLKYFEEHPVMCTSHKYYDLRNIIGTAIDWKIDADGFKMKFQWFVGKGNEEADWGWFLAQKGLAMFSVGFTVYDSVSGDAMDEKYRKLGVYRVFKDVELYEVSQVVIGCNRNALQLMIDDPVHEVRSYAYEVSKAFDTKPGDAKPEPDRSESAEVDASKTVGEPVPEPKSKQVPVIVPPNVAEIVAMYKSGKVLSKHSKQAVVDAVVSLKAAVSALELLIDMPAEKQEEPETVKVVSTTSDVVRIIG
jgi:hypothetical protein